jgi:hypothetical protein
VQIIAVVDRPRLYVIDDFERELLERHAKRWAMVRIAPEQGRIDALVIA